MSIQISVIIPTYNRLNHLEDTIDSLCKQVYPARLFEVLIIDSGTRGIENLSEKYMPHTNIRFIFDAERGASIQRNIGIEASKGDYLAFIDDDAIANPNWLQSFAEVFSQKEFGVLAGKILPLWTASAKDWHKKSAYIRNLYSMYDLGNTTQEIEYGFSCNYLIRKSALEEFGGFDTTQGRIGDERILYGEDVVICQKINQKYSNYYIPKAIVQHKVLEERLKLSWLIRRAYAGGFTKGIQNRKPKPHKKLKLTIQDYLLLFPYALGLLKGHGTRFFEKS